MKLIVRLLPTRATVAAVATVGLLCAGSVRAIEPQADPTAPRDAAIQTAELALGAGDCRGGAERYAALAESRRDTRIARRAVEVAMTCLHLPAAWRSASRWAALDPENVEALRAAGLVALELYRLDDARRIFGDLLGKPDVEADRALAELLPLVSEGDDANAAWRTFGAVVARDAVSDETRIALAELAVAADHFKDAGELARAVIAREPGNAAAHRLMALLGAANGDDAAALESARRAVEADPEEQRFTRVETLVELGRLEEAHAELERLQQDEDARSEAQRRLAMLAMASGDLDEAQRRFGERLQRGEGSAEAFFYLAVLAERRGDKELALQSYSRLVEAGAGLLPRMRAAMLMIEAGRREDALKLLDKVPPSGRNDPIDIAIARSNLLIELDDLRGALAAIDAALALYPEHPQLLYHRAMLQERGGRTADSIRAFEKLLKQRPQDPSVLNALGYTLGDHKRQLARAAQLVDEALRYAPDNAAILDSVGWLRFRRGDAAGAAPLLQRAYQISRDDEIAAHLAEVLWAQGDQGGARRIWAEALSRAPDSEPLRESFQRLTGKAIGGETSEAPR